MPATFVFDKVQILIRMSWLSVQYGYTTIAIPFKKYVKERKTTITLIFNCEPSLWVY